VALGGVLQLQWMLPHLLKIRMLPRPTRHFDDPGLRRILKLMARTAGRLGRPDQSADQHHLASFLASGSVSMAVLPPDRLMEFPPAWLGVAWANILMPSLPSITPTTTRPSIPTPRRGAAPDRCSRLARFRRARGTEIPSPPRY